MAKDIKNNPLTIILLGLVVLALIGVGVKMMVFNKMDAEITSLQDEKGKLERQIAQAQAFLQTERERKIEFAAMKERLKSQRQILPTRNEIEELVNHIEKAAKETFNIKINLFHRPEKQINREFFDELPIFISCNAGYNTLGGFFAHLANYHRIININNLTMKSLKKGKSSKLTLGAEFTASTFMYTGEKDEEIE